MKSYDEKKSEAGGKILLRVEERIIRKNPKSTREWKKILEQRKQRSNEGKSNNEQKNDVVKDNFITNGRSEAAKEFCDEKQNEAVEEIHRRKEERISERKFYDKQQNKASEENATMNRRTKQGRKFLR